MRSGAEDDPWMLLSAEEGAKRALNQLLQLALFGKSAVLLRVIPAAQAPI